ncbi:MULTISPECIES: hypothetical protein [unclassified Haladaptatus]|uniref:hypothetical protein n=1 Tax=unclassified Haladaptatus TaxID=2622732 RepID=UPI00209C54E6|nr:MULTISPECIES: hypothetical protein [unclassified Haladaptatus]MCO8245387.1 hypothetical protein [Haladaptatus sp. AB643]MCO8256824.1 hypothetical protein [Haladaptatus sp. AB618]
MQQPEEFVNTAQLRIKKTEAVVSSAVPYVPFVCSASAGTTKSLTITVVRFGIVFDVLGRECLECPVVGCGFDCGHVFAEGVAVDVMWAGTRHQVLGHVVDRDSILVGCGGLVANSDFDESGDLTSMARYRRSLSVH